MVVSSGCSVAGPSPRVRGAGQRSRRQGQQGRSIPACAGSSLPDLQFYPTPNLSQATFTETDKTPALYPVGTKNSLW